MLLIFILNIILGTSSTIVAIVYIAYAIAFDNKFIIIIDKFSLIIIDKKILCIIKEIASRNTVSTYFFNNIYIIDC